MNSGNQNNDSNNITTKPNETKTPSQGNKNTSVKSKQNPNKQLPIFIALAIIFVLCITGIIVSLSINKNSTSQEDFSATTLENFCNNNNGYFDEDDEKTTSYGTVKIKTTTYTCSDTGDNNNNFRITIADRDYASIIQDIANQDENHQKTYQDYKGQPSDYIKYIFGSNNNNNSYIPTITAITDTPDYYKGKLQITTNDETIDGDYYVVYKNILVNTTNENTLNDLNINR